MYFTTRGIFSDILGNEEVIEAQREGRKLDARGSLERWFHNLGPLRIATHFALETYVESHRFNNSFSLADIMLYIWATKDPSNLEIIPADQDRGEKGLERAHKGSYIVHYDRCLKTSKCDPKSDYIYDCKDGFS